MKTLLRTLTVLYFSLGIYGLTSAQTGTKGHLNPATQTHVVEIGTPSLKVKNANQNTPTASPESFFIQGFVEAEDNYIPNMSQTLTFILDWDWWGDNLDYVRLTFPTGMTPTSSATSIDGIPAVVNGQQVSWGTQVTGGSGNGPIQTNYVLLHVNVNVGVISGNKSVAYYLRSDQLGGDSPWAIGGSAIVSEKPIYSDLIWDNMFIASRIIVSSEYIQNHPDSTKFQLADDFLIPLGHKWVIDSIRVSGKFMDNGSFWFPPDSFTVVIWKGNPQLDSIVYSKTIPYPTPPSGPVPQRVNLNLPDNPEFHRGHYYLSVYAVYDIASNGTGNLGWWWKTCSQSYNNPSLMRNEIDGWVYYNVPAPLNIWTPLHPYGLGRSLKFAIHGSDSIFASIPDAGITNIDLPGISGPSTVMVELISAGTDTLNSATVNWSVDGVLQSPFTWTGNLLPDSSTMINIGNYTFPVGYFTIKAWTTAPNGLTDSIPENDTSIVAMVFQPLIDVFPYCESFESGLGQWAQSTRDNLDWTRHTGLVPSANTGPPSGAYDSLYYLYLESSPPAMPNEEAYLDGLFNFTNVPYPVLSFFYNMNGAAMGSLWVEVFDGTTWHYAIWGATGHQGSAWIYKQIDLQAFGNKNLIRIRINGVRGSNYTSDMAIDKVCVYQQPTDISVTKILEPEQFLVPNTTYPVKVVIKSFANVMLTSLPIKFSVDGGNVVSWLYTDTLSPNAVDTVVIGSFIAPAGDDHRICVWTDLSSDLNASNDTMCSPFMEAWIKQFHFPVNTGIFNQAGIESDGFSFFTSVWNNNIIAEYDLQGNLKGSFAISGVSGLLDIAYDGKYFYGSNGTANIWKMDFRNRKLLGTIPVASGALVTGIAYDPITDAFWINNWSTPLRLINRNGISISTIPAGPIGDIFGLAYDSLDMDRTVWGFSQHGSGCEIAEIDVATGLQTGIVYNVLRDVPVNNPGGASAGGLFVQASIIPGKWSLGGLIQNEAVFCYEIGNTPIPTIDVGVHSIDSPIPSCSMSSSENVIVTIRNYAYADASNFPVSYVLNGGNPVTQIVTDTLAPGAFKQITFNVTANLSQGNSHSLVAYTSLTNDSGLRNDTAKTIINLLPSTSVPYGQTFESNAENTKWLIVDSNNDGSSWTIVKPGAAPHAGTGHAQYSYNMSNPANDWLISPCITLDPANPCRLRFWYSGKAPEYTESLKVFVGTSPNAGSMTTQILDLASITGSAYQEASVNFTVPAAGVYYLGFQANSAANMWNLHIDDISIDHLTGIGEAEEDFSFRILPNPAGEIVSLAADFQIELIQVINPLNQVVITEKGSSTQHVLNVGSLAEGMYLVQITTASGKATKRLCITR